MSRARHFVLAAGGTGGHMVPAAALAEELMRRGHRVALVSDERGVRFPGLFDGVQTHVLPAGRLAGGPLGEGKKPTVHGAGLLLTALRRYEPRAPCRPHRARCTAASFGPSTRRERGHIQYTGRTAHVRPTPTRHASPPPAVEPEQPPGGSDAKTTFPAGDIPRGNMESGAKTIFPAGDIPRGNMFVAPARGDRGFPTELQPTFSRGCVGVVSGWFRRTPPRASSGW